MPITAEHVGRVYPATAPYRVSREAIRAFAHAVGDTTAGPNQDPAIAPPTFAMVVQDLTLQQLLSEPETGIVLSRVLHGEQKFHYQRPVRVGDELSATLSVASLRQIGGNDIIGTASEVRDAAGDLVCTTTATLVHRGEA